MKYKGLIIFFVLNELCAIPMAIQSHRSPASFILSAVVMFVFMAFVGIMSWLKARWWHYPIVLTFFGLIASNAYLLGRLSAHA